AFCKQLNALGLFEDMGAKFTLASGEERTLSGFKVINREKLKALSADDVQSLFNNDGLELVYLHLQSMQNLNKVLKHLPADAIAESAASDLLPDDATQH
ncbi:MAG: SapC family protein, partial [Pseudomonadales bacterium]|nr:SapC family protein [Pseudomonadales bacterium]